jgi:hypothetical protein
LPALASCVELLAQNHFPSAESHNKCSPSSKNLLCSVLVEMLLYVPHVQLGFFMYGSKL